MPVGATIAAAGITAGATVYGASKSSSANKQATVAQSQATEQALQFEREREATRKAEYEQAMGLYKQQWDAREQARLGLLRRYGINIPSAGGAGTPQTLSRLMSAQDAGWTNQAAPATAPTGTPDTQQPPMTLSNLRNWNDWRTRGIEA